MSTDATTLNLLKQDVPLALLFDIAGFGPSSQELYRSEGSRLAHSDMMSTELIAVAS